LGNRHGAIARDENGVDSRVRVAHRAGVHRDAIPRAETKRSSSVLPSASSSLVRPTERSAASARGSPLGRPTALVSCNATPLGSP
jgi:hypothetical protein